MSSKNRINEFVRRRIRKLRHTKKLKVREMAAKTNMPHSSYASMECGFYKINLDNLFRILGALNVDIREVWPVETIAELSEEKLYLQRLQQFRLGEVISLSAAEGAALFVLEGENCKLALHQGLSDFLLDRLIFYLQDGLPYQDGLWFKKTAYGKDFHFFLKASDCPDFLSHLIRKYLVVWAEVYAEP